MVTRFAAIMGIASADVSARARSFRKIQQDTAAAESDRSESGLISVLMLSSPWGGLRRPMLFTLRKALRPQALALAGLKMKSSEPFPIANFDVSSATADNRGRFELAAIPGDVNYVSASCAQTADRAAGPRSGKCRQKLNLSALRLQQHLGNPSRPGCIPVQ